MNVYFLSGLGADSRAFHYLRFSKDINVVHIPWIPPEDNESIKNYAARISKSIDGQSPFILVGLSFGGIIASEMMEYLVPVKTILISSLAKRAELPFYFRIAGNFRLNRFSFTSNKPNAFTYWLFGTATSREKLLLKEILQDTDAVFTNWAIGELLNWRRKDAHSSIIRIHGSKDRLLPITNFKPDYLINGGGHLMVLNHADEISAILAREFRV